MTLFGKVPINREICLEAELVPGMKPAAGILSLPFQGLALEMKCGDVCHLNLKNTIHVPDLTRDEDNWSWVHGP